jgi:hypothetical protein
VSGIDHAQCVLTWTGGSVRGHTHPGETGFWVFPAEATPEERDAAAKVRALTTGAFVRIPGHGGHTSPRRRAYGLLLTRDAEQSRATGAVTLYGEVRGLDGTTTRRKPLHRTTVQRPGNVELPAEDLGRRAAR